MERFRGLFGQTVDQVRIDGFVAQCPRFDHQVVHALIRLDPVHCLLHLRVEVLDTEADAVETDRRQIAQPLRSRRSRIDLDRDLGLGRELEGALQRSHQITQLGVIQEGRRAAAQVQLRNRLARPQFGDVELDLLVQQLQVVAPTAVVPVSYTHLDVYKRQAYSAARSRAP